MNAFNSEAAIERVIREREPMRKVGIYRALGGSHPKPSDDRDYHTLIRRVTTMAHQGKLVGTPVGASGSPLIYSLPEQAVTVARSIAETNGEQPDWHNDVLARLAALSPDEFERLVAFLMAENGVYDIEVTGRSSDGGIDGRGSLVRGKSVPVLWQAKRHQGVVVSDSLVSDTPCAEPTVHGGKPTRA